MRAPCSLILALLAAGVGAIAAPSAWGSSRLGSSVVPRFESVRLELDPAQKDYRGSVHIEIDVAAATDSLRFHAQDMTLRRVVLRGPKGWVRSTTTTGPHGLITLRAAKLLTPGAYTLDIDFTNDFNTKAASLYRLETGGAAYAFTQFEAVDARGAFPCWDEPAFKIPWQMTMVVPGNQLAVFNTPIEKETTSGSTRTITFRKTKPLSSYLLAIAVGPLETVDVPGMSIPGRVVTVKGASHLTGEAVRITPPILAALERYFGQPYPYEKLDLIAVPEFWPGAMENAGAITFADRILLVDPATVSVRQRRSLVTVMAHEIAHMWFGDVVTMAWWDDLWLNESFADWIATKVTDEVHPELRYGVSQLEGAQFAFRTDARLSTRAMRQPVGDDVNLDQLADELAYNKGEAVLGMFESWLSPETFRRGVIRYLEKHAWGNAAGADLWNALGDAAGNDVAGPMATFLDQPGTPLVSAEPMANGTVRLRQRRFLNHGLAEPAPTMWKIPVVLRYSDGRNAGTHRVLLTEAQQIVRIPGASRIAWLHPNADEKGYYRWWVPPAVLQRLTTDAAKTLNERERAGLLGNAAALLDAGEMRGDEYARLLARFADDSSPFVVTAVIHGIEKVRNAFVTPDLESAFAAWVRVTLQPATRRIGISPREGEADAVGILRPTLLGALGKRGRDPAVLGQAVAWSDQSLRDPSSLDASLAQVALEIQAQKGDATYFDTLRVRFENATAPAERRRYLSALGGFRRPEIVEKALKYSIEGPLRPQEILSIPFAITEDPALEARAFRWMAESYDAIVQRAPPSYIANLVYFGAGCDAELLARARRFFEEPGHQPFGIGEELKKMISATEDCIALREREGTAVARFLARPQATR